MAFWQAAATIGTGLLVNKINRNTAPEQQSAAIGSGTAPSLDAGPAIEIKPIGGSQVNEFGEFEYDDPTESNSDNENLIALLQQLGIEDLDGLAGLTYAAYGGALKRPEPFQNLQELDDFLDFTEGSELNLQELLSQMGGFGTSLMPSQKEGLLSLIPSSDNEETSLVELDADGISLVDSNEKIAPVAMYNSTSNNPILDINKNSMKEKTLAGLDNTINPTLGERFSSLTAPIQNYTQENPEMTGVFLDSVMSLINNKRARDNRQPARGRQVMTQTLPAGGLGAKRDYLRQISPIQGSKFAADGGALDRPMFKPMLEGGDIEGPGGPKDDVIPVMASNGEFMLSNAAVKHMGKGNHDKGIAMLEQFNKQGNKRYG